MIRCKRCLYPDSKPDLLINEDGICSACLAFDARQSIDWKQREKDFLNLVDQYRGKGTYDCIVPVSGGKDSHYQVIKMVRLGLKPLAVTATTCDLSPIGRRNLDNIASLGIDHLELTPCRTTRRRLNKFCLETVGDISWPEHVAIFTTPVRVAVQMNIPLIIWGECPQNEYGGPAADANTLDRRWLEEFGGLLGLRVSDLDIPRDKLIPYQYPDDRDLQDTGVTGLFLGYYSPWDGEANANLADRFGFERYHTWVEGSICDYENLDNHQTGTHDLFKWLKFGFGRATDIACNKIRRGRLTRKEAQELVKGVEGKVPETYLGKPLDYILDEIGMTRKDFLKICWRFKNRAVHDAKN